ncbi:MAG: hypothetical protein PHO48_04600 [Candidatus Gracilibacteria bacterium]|nr:hypothetical protein [Candidatus Gracilibacteria bacterium]MDD5179368.1 hypothetical protein [Candidatus Gracilibacteria bacterium]
MKKLFTILVLTSLLFTGCKTINQQNFLDEKIKCKKLAEEKFDGIEEDLAYPMTHSSLHRGYSTYSAALDTCLISYSISFNDEKNQWTGNGVRRIEDILKDKVLTEITTTNSNDVAEVELAKQKEIEFDKKFKLYFEESAE